MIDILAINFVARINIVQVSKVCNYQIIFIIPHLIIAEYVTSGTFEMNT
ncbi:hypothetical protein SDC9_131889 [bioreactor metagenome]|uniref:Uncharacterized protein n=1 Tax=bioreactor metagenome TaxID=1076179 RepID=A0A645D787_9ZZZZ